MAEKTRDELKSYFQSGKRPTGQQFADLIDSVLNKLEDGVGADSNNNLGIGIATPNARLHVFNEQSDGLLIESGNWPEWTMISNPNDHRSKITLDPVSGALQFRLGQGATGVDGVGDSKLVINQNGNVGIGTNNPNAGLVIGNIGPNDDVKMLGFGEVGTAGAWFASGFAPNDGENRVKFMSSFGNLMTWKYNGNVGIGTNDPQTKLHIQQSDIGIATNTSKVLLQGTDTLLDIISSSDATWGSGINLIEGSGNTNTDMWSIIRTTSVFSTPGLRIKYGNANNPTVNPDFIAVTPQGNLGIGTNNPNAKLVIGNIGPNDDIKMLGFGEVGTAGAWFASGFAPSDGENRVKFMSGFGNLMTWKFNGNIGIGTNDPQTKLHIQQSDIGTATNNSKVLLQGTDTLLDIISSDAGTWGSGINLIEGSGNTNTDIWSIIRTTSVFSTPSLRIKYGNANNPTINQDLAAITPEGNLGIGTINPDAKLGIGNIGPNDDVKMLGFGESGTSGAWFASGFAPNGGENRIKFMSGFGNLMTWKFNGNIGIGTNDPQTKLHIQQSDIGTATNNSKVLLQGTDTLLDVISSSDATWGSGINLIEGIENTNANIWSIIRTTSNAGVSGLRIKYGNANNPTVNPDFIAVTPQGNLGIGTNNPNAKLVIGNIGGNDDVKMLGFGEGGTAGAWFASGFAPNDGENRVKFMSGFGNLMTWKFNGNVGIGTTNPAYKLDVNGIIQGNNVAASDRRLKKQIKNINKNAVSQLRELRGVSYQYKKKVGEDKTPDQRRNFGFIAQEVKEVFPDLVYEDHEGMLSLSYTGLIPVLTEAVKDMDNSIKKRDKTIAELKATNKKRDKTIEELKQGNKKLHATNKKQQEINRKQEDMIKKLDEANKKLDARLARLEAQLGNYGKA